MGASSSKQLPEGKSPGLGKSLVHYATDKAPTSYWNPEPRVILSNDSDYIVSYWVVEEEKKRSSAQQQKIARSIGLHLNASFIHNRSKIRSSSDNSNTSNSTTGTARTTSSEDDPEKTQQQQEETLGTEEQEQGVKEEGGFVNNSNCARGPTLSDDVKKKQKNDETLQTTEEEEEEDEVYYLMRDHRMGRKASTQPTQVPFPAGCQHMRAYGFFERDGEWQCFKDQVYSIALINKNFRIAASTSNVTPCSDKNSKTPKRLLLGKQVTA